MSDAPERRSDGGSRLRRRLAAAVVLLAVSHSATLTQGVPAASTEDRVKTIVAELMGVLEEDLSSEVRFRDDLGADELDLVELLMALEEEFEIEIPDVDGERLLTLGEVVAYVSRTPAEQPAASGPGARMAIECPMDLVKAVYQALRTNDFASIEPLYLDERHLESVLAVSEVPAETLREAWPEAVAKIHDRAESSFDEIVARGRAAGIDWSSSELGTISLREKTVRGMPLADLFFDVRHEGTTYRVHLDDAQRSSEGWHLVFLGTYEAGGP